VHRAVRKLLPDTEGASEWVVAINFDIRGFSSAMSANPSETALYLKKLYARVLDTFFEDHSFFQPTGDGLFVVVPFKEPELHSEVRLRRPPRRRPPTGLLRPDRSACLQRLQPHLDERHGNEGAKHRPSPRHGLPPLQHERPPCIPSVTEIG